MDGSLFVSSFLQTSFQGLSLVPTLVFLFDIADLSSRCHTISYSHERHKAPVNMSDNSCSKSNPEAAPSAQTKNKQQQQQPSFATRVPIGEQDSDRVQANKAGLNEYFAAVALSLHKVSKQEKLQRISQVFSPTAELIAPSGKIFRNEQILSFYQSEQSPVLARANFCPQINVDTLCVSADGRTIAVEIALTDTMHVGDWFTFNDQAKICRLKIYRE